MNKKFLYGFAVIAIAAVAAFNVNVILCSVIICAIEELKFEC